MRKKGKTTLHTVTYSGNLVSPFDPDVTNSIYTFKYTHLQIQSLHAPLRTADHQEQNFRQITQLSQDSKIKLQNQV